MKKSPKKLLISALLIISVISVLNVSVTTRKGVNYKIHTIEIPLYLKILGFYERHYNYKYLTKTIIKNTKSDKEKALKLLEWTYKNMKDIPAGLPIVDDHVWHTIVRGYGVPEQFSDIFTTLCNYADLDAFMYRLYTKEKSSKITVSFVKTNKQWTLFDPYNGAYFKNQKGGLSTVEDIIKSDWSVKTLGHLRTNVQYGEYFENITSINYKDAHKWSRANIQSPLNRLVYSIRKIIY